MFLFAAKTEKSQRILLVNTSYLQPSLIFAGKGGNQPYEGAPTPSLVQIKMDVADSHKHFSLLRLKKSFVTQIFVKPGPNVIKLFAVVFYECL